MKKTRILHPLVFLESIKKTVFKKNVACKPAKWNDLFRLLFFTELALRDFFGACGMNARKRFVFLIGK